MQKRLLGIEMSSLIRIGLNGGIRVGKAPLVVPKRGIWD